MPIAPGTMNELARRTLSLSADARRTYVDRAGCFASPAQRQRGSSMRPGRKSRLAMSMRCCATGRLGLMLANRGTWLGKTVVPADWLTASAADALATDSALAKYGYQIWFSADTRRFALRGLRGQFVFVDPGLKLVLVQTALSGGPPETAEPPKYSFRGQSGAREAAQCLLLAVADVTLVGSDVPLSGYSGRHSWLFLGPPVTLCMDRPCVASRI
jgi:hypothetical protein